MIIENLRNQQNAQRARGREAANCLTPRIPGHLPVQENDLIRVALELALRKLGVARERDAPAVLPARFADQGFVTLIAHHAQDRDLGISRTSALFPRKEPRDDIKDWEHAPPYPGC